MTPIAPRKATNHRKRHIPSGPAGIFFQQQEFYNQGNTTKPGIDRLSHQEVNTRNVSDSTLSTFDPHELGSSQGKTVARAASTAATQYSTSWMKMQLEFRIKTPSLAPTLSPLQRYHRLREFYKNYSLIPDVLEMGTSWKLSLPLLVLIEHVYTSPTCWTVQATDETGYRVLLWLDPSWVHETFYKAESMSVLEGGTTWKIENATVVLSSEKNDPMDENEDPFSHNDNHIQRIVLVGKDNLMQSWTASQDEKCNQQIYLQWMEQKSQLSSGDLNNEELGRDVGVHEHPFVWEDTGDLLHQEFASGSDLRTFALPVSSQTAKSPNESDAVARVDTSVLQPQRPPPKQTIQHAPSETTPEVNDPTLKTGSNALDAAVVASASKQRSTSSSSHRKRLKKSPKTGTSKKIAGTTTTLFQNVSDIQDTLMMNLFDDENDSDSEGCVGAPTASTEAIAGLPTTPNAIESPMRARNRSNGSTVRVIESTGLFSGVASMNTEDLEDLFDEEEDDND